MVCISFEEIYKYLYCMSCGRSKAAPEFGKILSKVKQTNTWREREKNKNSFP